MDFWLARDLQTLLGYTKWDNFQKVIVKAKTACETSGYKTSDHFADVGNTIAMPKGAQNTIDDIMLTRYACYLIAQKRGIRPEELPPAEDIKNVSRRLDSEKKKSLKEVKGL